MATQQQEIVLPYKPHWGQQLIHDSKAQWKVLKCGRRWGKGRCAVMEMIRCYLKWMYETRDPSLLPKIQMMIMGPTFEGTAQPWLELQEFLRPLDKAGLVKRILQDEKKVTLWLPDGECVIEIKSADKPESALGRGIDFLWCTEAPYIENEVWNSTLVPMLRSPGRKGFAFIEGRPESEDSYFERLFEAGQTGIGYIESWKFTTLDNPLVNVESVMADAAHMPDHIFRKEYMAETLGDSFAAFRNVDGCVGGAKEEPVKDKHYVMGIDLGKAVDWTVIVIGDPQKRKVLSIERFSKIDWASQKERIIATSKKWNNARICMDTANIGSAICDDLRKAGLSILAVNTHSPKEKNKLIDNLALAFEKATLKIPKADEMVPLIAECKLYRRITTTKTGILMKNAQMRAPYGKHDDCVMALALFLNLCVASGSSISVKSMRFGRF